jgi:von Willebrand factor type D domain
VHLVTFDGLKYDCQGEGEFVVMASLSKGSKFEIQGRFTRFHADKRITVTRGLVVNTGDPETPIVQLDLPMAFDSKTSADSQCIVDMYIDKKYRHLSEGSGFGNVVITKLAANKYRLLYPITGVDLEFEVYKSSMYGCYFNVKICLPKDYRSDERLIGLLGSPNGSPFDDWMKPDGTFLPPPITPKTTRFMAAYDYCVDNWCIFNEKDSLFFYNASQGETFDKYFKCGDTYKPDIQKCVENQEKKTLVDICGANEECLIDGCGGDEQDAKRSLVVEDIFVETKCARQIFFDDFNGKSYPEWGEWGQVAEIDGQRYLGPLGGKKTTRLVREFVVPEDAESLTVEFLFYEFDNWSGERGDKVYASVGDVRVDLERFEQIDTVENPSNQQSGKFGDVIWSRYSMTKSEDIILGGGKDQVHKVMLKVPPSQYRGGKLAFEFEVAMNTPMEQASGGLDNFRIIAHFPCQGDPEEKVFNDTRMALPRTCAGYKASWNGDPHMSTFDGLKYDCQGSGEFVVMKSPNSTFTIQGRFVKFVPSKKPTVTKSVVIKAGNNVPVIQINVPSSSENGRCKPFAYLGGKKLDDIRGLDKGQVAFQSEVLSSSKADGLVIYFHDLKVQVEFWAKSSSVNGCVLGTTVCVSHDSPLLYDKFVGILGTPNGNVEDDWTTGKGDVVPIPLTNKARIVDAYEYCVDNWCIHKPVDSLFTYDKKQGESFDSFEDCGAPKDEETFDCVESNRASPQSDLYKICGEDSFACYVDGCVGGIEDAKKAIEGDNDEVDYGCAEQIEFEDFGPRYTGSWGRAVQDTAFGSPFLRLHKGQAETFKDITAPTDADVVTMEFLFHEIDQWEAEDVLMVSIDDVNLNLGTFGPAAKWDSTVELDNYVTGVTGGISWTRYSLTEPVDLGFDKTSNDQTHFVSISIPNTKLGAGFFRLKLKVVLTNDEAKQSAGFDDIRIMALKFACESPQDATLSPPTEMKDLPSVALPVICRGDAATIGFDISTFDDFDYSCRADGEFILARATKKGSEKATFEVQGRFENFHPSKLSSMPRGVVIKDADFPTVQISVPSDMKQKNANGKPDKDAPSGQCPIDLYVGKVYQPFTSSYSNEGVRVEKVGQEGRETVVIYYPTSGVQITATVKQSSWLGCYLVVKLCLPDDYLADDDMVGLFGSRDNDMTNDWMNRKGKTLSMKKSDKRFKAAFKYCTENWCIPTQEESLFAYDKKDTFEKHSQKCSSTMYNDAVPKCMRNPPLEIRSVCGSSLSCLDAGCSGDVRDASDSVALENDLLEQRCGDLITFEDFNDGKTLDFSGWKEISAGKLVNARREGSGVIGSNRFLGRLSKNSPMIEKQYSVPKSVRSITLEFSFFEIDNWSSNGGRDTMFIDLNGYRIDLGFIDPKNSMVKDGITVRRESLARPTNMGFNQDFFDQTHRIIIEVPPHVFQTGRLKVEFRADLSLEELMESAGIDNFRMTAHSKSCRVTWTGEELSPEKIGKILGNKRKKTGSNHRSDSGGGKRKPNDSIDGKKKPDDSNTNQQAAIQTDNKQTNQPNGPKDEKKNSDDGTKAPDSTMNKQATSQPDKKQTSQPTKNPTNKPTKRPKRKLTRNRNGQPLLDAYSSECRSVFAFHSHRVSAKFQDMGYVNHFGWSSGPFADSNFAYTFSLFAEAPTAEEKKLLVGTMSVDYDGVEAVLTIDALGEHSYIYFQDIHAYAGTSRLPTASTTTSTVTPGGKKVDPAQFPIAHHFNLDEDKNKYDPSALSVANASDSSGDDKMSSPMTFVVSGFEDDPIYVAVHMTVCGDFAAEESQRRQGTEDSKTKQATGFRGASEYAGQLPRHGVSNEFTEEQAKIALAESGRESTFVDRLRKIGF